MSSLILCKNAECSAPQTGCLGHGLPLSECPDYPASEGQKTSGADKFDAKPESSGERPWWSGNALTPRALRHLCGDARPRIVAMIGLADAGKTSVLSTLYLLLKARKRPTERGFAGSFTLLAWEGISHRMHWRGDQPPTYPARTTGEGREPGLLHLRLAGVDGYENVLLTDVPGEWFREWARDRNHAAAAGARWIAEHADVLWLFVDGEALSKRETRNRAARESLALIERMKVEQNARPVSVVWTKDDLTATNAVLEDVRNALNVAFPRARQFAAVAANSHADAMQNVLESFADVLTVHCHLPTIPLVVDDRAARLATLIVEGM